MVLGLARRMLTEPDPRALRKLVWNMGVKGVRSVQLYKRRLKRGEHFPPFLFISVISGCQLRCHGCRRRPAQVDETHAAPIPRECPDCGGAVERTREASQYQEDLPVVRPVVRRFAIEVGHCTRCQRRVQGRHELQTSDALGAAGVQLGPAVVALLVELHTEMGVPLAKVAHLLRTTFGLQVTPGGLAHVLHRAARAAAPAYTELCEQVRNAPVVTPDETGWRVGGERHWLWTFVTPETTVYAICPGRGFADAATVLGTDYVGVLVRDGWAPYRCYDGLHQTCLNHYADVGIIPMSALMSRSCRASSTRRSG